MAMNAPQRDAQPLSKVILLLIDPQLDFHDTLEGSVRKLPKAVTEEWMTELSPATNGSLAVNGSAVDSVAISNMIMKHMKEIDEIYVTLDTHHVNHIGHAAFWWKGEVDKKVEPTPLVDTIRHADIVSKKYQPKDQSLMDHVLHYSQQLENKGNFTEMQIWPEHCLIGTSGHAVVGNINRALQSWSEYHMKVIEYIHKGENCLTEMYSAIEAEVPIPTDPNTQTNKDLIHKLKQAKKLLICGQAKSLTVKFTTNDIVKYWVADGFEKDDGQGMVRRNPADIILLEDGMSPVQGFEAKAEEFIAYVTSADAIARKLQLGPDLIQAIPGFRGVSVATTTTVFGDKKYGMGSK